MPSLCAECDRLWLVNAQAVRVHTMILWREYRAKNVGQESSAFSLGPLRRDAEARRRLTRKAFDFHNAARHAFLTAHA